MLYDTILLVVDILHNSSSHNLTLSFPVSSFIGKFNACVGIVYKQETRLEILPEAMHSEESNKTFLQKVDGPYRRISAYQGSSVL